MPIPQDVDEIIEVPYEQDFIVEEDFACDLDDDEPCEEICFEAYEVDSMDPEEGKEDVEEPILMKRETINNHQHRVNNQIIFPRLLSARHPKVTGNSPNLVKRMSIGHPLVRVPSHKITMKRRGTENESAPGLNPNLVKRKHIDRAATFKANHPDGIVQKREVVRDKSQSKMVKRMAIGNEMRRVSGEHWTMPHRREVDKAESLNLIKRMAVGHENRVVQNQHGIWS